MKNLFAKIIKNSSLSIRFASETALLARTFFAWRGELLLMPRPGLSPKRDLLRVSAYLIRGRCSQRLSCCSCIQARTS